MTGDFGKPRPAMIVRSDTPFQYVDSVIVCPLTRFDEQAPNFRFSREPDATNGPRARSQAMVEKPITISRRRVGQKIGALSDDDIGKLDTILAFVMGLSG